MLCNSAIGPLVMAVDDESQSCCRIDTSAAVLAWSNFEQFIKQRRTQFRIREYISNSCNLLSPCHIYKINAEI